MLEMMNGRLDKMDARFDRMDARFDKIEGRLDTIEGRLDRLEQGQAEIRADIKGAQAFIADIVEVVGEKTDSHERTVCDIQGATVQNSYDIQALKNRVQALYGTAQ